MSMLDAAEEREQAPLSNADVGKLLREAKAVTSEAAIEFGQLSAEQLNWRPSDAEWSIGQCFDHLITTNLAMFPQIDEVIRGEKRQSFWENLPVVPGLWGKFIISRARPETVAKSKAPRVFEPSQSAIGGDIIARFVEHQTTFAEKLEATARVELTGTRVTSPVAKFVTYSLLDALRILVFHERRHFNQARRVLQSEGFPRS
jgi:hypothetical protein